MPYFQHEFANVEDYLHHRRPYLLVEEIVSISDTEVVTRRRVADTDFFLDGHFPSAPIVPGSIMQEFTTQSAGILIAARFNPMPAYNTHDPFANEYALGVLTKVQNARYRSFTRSGDTLTCRVLLTDHVSNVFNFSASVSIDDRVVMTNDFRLTNIKSAVLRGAEPVV